MPKKRSWYAIEAKADGKEADVFIYDDIGMWGITAQDFVKDLSEITAPQINSRINCRGGDVFEGVAIYNALKNHEAKVVSHIESLAASIASIIALAGDEVHIADNAFYMIHNPYSWAVGDADAMRRAAGMLDKVTDSLIKTYTNKTGKESEEIKQLMADETWFTAEEAREIGFADAITEEDESATALASFDLSVFNNVPQHAFSTISGGKPSPRKLEHALREVGGLSNADAKAVVAKGYKVLDHREDGKGEGHREDDDKLKNKTQEEKGMTRDEIKAKFPDTYNAIATEAKEGLLSADDVAAKVEEGITAENARLLALDKLNSDMPGHETIIAGFKADRSITAAAAALQIIAAHGEKLKGITAQQAVDAAGLNNVPGTDGGEGGSEGAKDFVALVADYQTEHECSKGKAIKAIASSHPKEHKAYIKEQNKEVENV